MAAKERGNQVKDSVINIKNYIVALPKKRKVLFGCLAAAIVLAAVLLTFFLNGREPAYKVLYSGLDSGEAATVYARLQEMGAQPQLDGSGNVMVRAESYDQCLLQLASEGLPKTGRAYDIFDNHSGLTATEAELDQYKLYQLQDSIQETLKKIDGVQGAVVNIVPARESDFIWEQATSDARATASVLLTLRAGTELTPEQVQTIKNLVAASIHKLSPADVTVADAATSIELYGTDEGQSGYSAGKNLELEALVQQRIEDNIVRLLTPTYGKDGVVAVAKVTLDFDAMMTEKYDMSGVPDEEGNPTNDGYPTHASQAGSVNGEVPLSQGIAGEENNTDIPGYVYTNPTANGGGTSFSRDVTIDYNYIKTQIEKGNAVISRATIAVMVNEPGMSEPRRQELIDNISKGADIPPELISVGTFRIPTPPAVTTPGEEEPGTEGPSFVMPWWGWLIAAAAALAVLTVSVVLIVRWRKRRRREERMLEAREEEEARLAAERAAAQRAMADSATEDTGSEIINQVRSFAKTNPEITAELLRSWLKEGDET